MIPVPIGRCEFDRRNDVVSRFLRVFLRTIVNAIPIWRSEIEKIEDA